MKITLEEGLSRLAANPKVAAEFDRCAPGLSRREHVQSIITLIDATLAETAALKNKLAATKAKLQALEAAKLSQSSFMKTSQLPTQAPTVTTAAVFATAPLIMARAEFVKLSAADKARFVKSKGQLV